MSIGGFRPPSQRKPINDHSAEVAAAADAASPSGSFIRGLRTIRETSNDIKQSPWNPLHENPDEGQSTLTQGIESEHAAISKHFYISGFMVDA